MTERGIVCFLSQSQPKVLTVSENCPTLSSLQFDPNTIKAAPFHSIYLYTPCMSRPSDEDNNIKFQGWSQIQGLDNGFRCQNTKSHTNRVIFMLTRNVQKTQCNLVHRLCSPSCLIFLSRNQLTAGNSCFVTFPCPNLTSVARQSFWQALQM